MSGLTIASEDAVLRIKSNFPDAGPLLSRKISAITNSSATAGNYFIDSSGISELTVTPVTYSVLVCFAQSTPVVGAAWLDDPTVDADTLQVVMVPAGTTKSITFDPPITSWGYLSIGAGSTVVYQEKAR